MCMDSNKYMYIYIYVYTCSHMARSLCLYVCAHRHISIGTCLSFRRPSWGVSSEGSLLADGLRQGLPLHRYAERSHQVDAPPSSCSRRTEWTMGFLSSIRLAASACSTFYRSVFCRELGRKNHAA